MKYYFTRSPEKIIRIPEKYDDTAAGTKSIVAYFNAEKGGGPLTDS